MTDFFDDFAARVRRAATLASYGEPVSDPLLRAAAELYLAPPATRPHPHCSNGALRFAVYVPAPASVARAVCHAARHLSPTPALRASGICPKLFERHGDA